MHCDSMIDVQRRNIIDCQVGDRNGLTSTALKCDYDFCDHPRRDLCDRSGLSLRHTGGVRDLTDLP